MALDTPVWQDFFFSLPGLGFVAFYGAAVGSFLNVVAYRLPRGISTVSPRSRCPRCCSAIRPWHNLPVLGWLALGGRCRDCHLPISLRYPLVEAVTAALFVFSFLAHPGRLALAAASCALAAWALALVLIDFDLRVLPDSLTLPALAAGLAGRGLFGGRAALADSAAAAFAAWALFALLSWVFRRWRRQDGFGAGDGRMAAALGALFGSAGLAVLLPLAALLGLALALTERLRRRPAATVPFGAALGLAALTCLLAWPGGWP